MTETTYSRERSSVFDEVLYQFEKDFLAGKQNNLEAYLTGEGESRWRLLLELLHSNLELRLRAGEKLYVKDYLVKYPELAQRPGDILSLLAVEIRYLNEQGQKPVLEEYEQDYGNLIPSSLKSLFERPSSQTSDQNIGKLIAQRYRLVGVLGQGGMGTVYLAEQSEPVKRQVALKLIRTGIDSRKYITRFEAERQALAMMDHPNIARVYDGGTTDHHQPYFVMELVHGVPITHYCDQQKLHPKVRLELYVQICQAVQHAHQKGIIHRDLKPGNVLVTVVDGKPVPKVIDFGLAKATEQPLTDETIEERGAVGTPAYMSPEQADPENMDVDTRTDVYALGVILYELLTGHTPIDVKQFRHGALLEMLHMLREVDPPKPSTKLSSADELPSIAANRAVEPKELLSWVRGDIDWIVMKALEKDRNRRYETANDFAADVKRYLSGEAVLAHPPGRWYRMKKFVRRNKLQVVAAGLVVGALVAGITGTSWQAYRANQARKDEAARADGERVAKLDALEQKEKARAAEKLAHERLLLVESEKKRADTERHIANTVNYFLQDKLLLQAGATKQADSLTRLGKFDVGVKRNPTIRELLDRAALELTPDKIEDNLPKAPLVQASILRTLGMTYFSIGDYSKAIEHIKRAIELYQVNLAKDDLAIASALGDLAVVTSDSGNHSEAIKLFQQVLVLREKQQGRSHHDYLSLQCSLAETLRRFGNLNEALELLRQVRETCELSLGPDHHLTLVAMSNLAGLHIDTANYQGAIKLLMHVSKIQKQKLNANHPDSLITLTNLGLAYQGSGMYQQAIDLYQELEKKCEAIFGKEDLHTVTVIHGLAVCLQSTRKYPESVILFEKILPIMENKLGPKNVRTLTARTNLGVSLISVRQHSKAIQLLEKVKEDQEATLGKYHQETLPTLNGLGVAYWETRQLDKAVKIYEDALKRADRIFGRSHMMTLLIMANLGVNYNATGNVNEGIPLLEEALRKKTSYPQLAMFETQLLNAYLQSKRVQDAKPMIDKYIIEDRLKYRSGSVQLAGALSIHGSEYMQFELYSDAEPILRECYEIRSKAQPAAWATFYSQSQLGLALLRLKNYEEAEAFLLKGYQGLVDVKETIPPQGKFRLSEALDRLIQLYTETNKPEELKKWQAERAKYPAKPLETKK